MQLDLFRHGRRRWQRRHRLRRPRGRRDRRWPRRRIERRASGTRRCPNIERALLGRLQLRVGGVLHAPGAAGLRRRLHWRHAPLRGGYRMREQRRGGAFDLRPRGLFLPGGQSVPTRLQRRWRLQPRHQLRQRSPLYPTRLHGHQRSMPDRFHLRLHWSLRAQGLHGRHGMLERLRRGFLLRHARDLPAAGTLRVLRDEISSARDDNHRKSEGLAWRAWWVLVAPRSQSGVPASTEGHPASRRPAAHAECGSVNVVAPATHCWPRTNPLLVIATNVPVAS